MAFYIAPTGSLATIWAGDGLAATWGAAKILPAPRARWNPASTRSDDVTVWRHDEHPPGTAARIRPAGDRADHDTFHSGRARHVDATPAKQGTGYSCVAGPTIAVSTLIYAPINPCIS